MKHGDSVAARKEYRQEGIENEQRDAAVMRKDELKELENKNNGNK